MIKRVLSILLACLMILSFTACQDGSTPAPNGSAGTPNTSDSGTSADNSKQEPVHIKVGFFDPGTGLSQSQKAVFDAFTAENPNIIPEFQFITSDSYGANWNVTL